MFWTRFAGAAALWAVSAAPLAAQTQPVGDPPDASPFVVVDGLAKKDLLNVRAAASPVGRTLGRLPNGAMLRNLGCREFDGYKWCEVETLDEEAAGLKGWTPARYLFASVPPEGLPGSGQPPVDSAAAVGRFPDESGTAAGADPGTVAELSSSPPAQAPQAAIVQGSNAPAAEDGLAVVAAPSSGPAPDAPGAAAIAAQPVPTPDLSARMGGEASPPLALESLQRSAAAAPEEPTAETSQAPAPAPRAEPAPVSIPTAESNPAVGEPAGVQAAAEEQPVKVAVAAPVAAAEPMPTAQVTAVDAQPPAPQAAEPAPAPRVFYDGFLQHGLIAWAVAALAALAVGLLRGSGQRQPAHRSIAGQVAVRTGEARMRS
ncbi:MAG TPA: SH3 domain-containing protein [Mesorhizobium sp.]|jgi:hypothetical protein|nr:SH3 domain-containing protein [Mesorhizobium sp.]